MIRIARDPRLFTFLSDCAVRPRVVAGDGRRSLRDASAGRASASS